jgi:chitodextrinase
LPDPKDQANTEIFSPPYLFKGARPVISSAPAVVSYGAGFSVATPDAARIASVSLIALGAVFDENQRFVPLTFQPAGGSLNVQGPINGNTAPPGPYMLFLVDTNGVPSIAAMVRVGGAAPPADTTPPTAPTNVVASASGTQVTVSWTAATDNVGVTGYRVERCQGAGCTTFAEVGSVTGLSFVDAGLAATSSYSYRVRATDAAGLLGPYSTVASATTGSAPPLPTGLVAAYGFDESSGPTATDASGNTNTGTITNAARSGAGKFGGALSFDGTSARVTVPDAASLDLTNAATLEAWVRPSVAPAGWRAILHKDVDRYYLMAGSEPNHRPAVGGTFGGANQNVIGTSVLAVNTWTHLAATYDRTTIRLYVNGVQVASGAQTAAIATSNAVLTIGADYYGEHFAGLIDEVRIYNRALTAGEIQTDMVTPVSGP